MDSRMMQQSTGNLTGNQPIDQQQPRESQGGFSINATQIEDTIKEHIEPKQVSALDRVVKAGHELMFGKDTHNKIMDGLEDSQDIGGDLGSGAANMMLLLFKQSGNTIPGDVIIPAGVILLARASEFFKESGIPITDDDFEEAVHTFSTITMNKLDPEFQRNVAGYNVSQEQQGQQEIPQQPSPPLMQQRGGLLGSTARA